MKKNNALIEKQTIIVLVVIVLLIKFLTTLSYAIIDYPHFGVNNIGCDSCHFVFGTEPSLLPPWTAAVQVDIDDTQYNKLCRSCHNDIDAPFVRTHSSLNTDDSYGNWTVECRVCHNPHFQKQSKTHGSESYLYSGTSTGITTTTLTKSGAAWSDDEYQGYVVYPNTSQTKYNYQITGNTSDTLTIEGPVDLTKASAGDTFAIVYGQLINSTVTLDEIIGLSKTGDKEVKYFWKTGSNSFADGDGTYDGVCEVCHTQTTHFRNDGSGSEQLHTNVGTPAGTDCSTCHSHDNGFSHKLGSGTGCDECHGHDPGYGGATGGAGSYETHSSHTENDSDDFRGPNTGCSTCHNTSNFPDFADGVSYADYKSGTATTVCDTCHSPGGTYDGVNDSEVGALNNWENGIYNGNILKPGKEKWCATCHDEDPSEIQSINAPNVIGDEDGVYTYGTGWGYYKTGHGLSGQTYPSSGGMVSGAGKECNNCHDYSLSHIDGAARTFDCSDGCSSTEYRESYRLKLVDGVNPPLRIPRPVLGVSEISPDDFRLCLQGGCHNSEQFTNYDVLTTNFRDATHGDQYEAGHAIDDPPFNLHAYHLRGEETSRFFPDWSGGTESQTTCITCHNVHGSTQLAMVRDGRLNGKGNGMEIYYNAMSSTDTLNQSTVTYFSGPSTANLCETCHTSGNYPFTRTPLSQEIPTLTWTGETGYIADGVNPDSGLGGNQFVFRVTYTDSSSEEPKYIQVWIDENDNGTYETGEKYNMAAVDPTDTDYSDGKLYQKTVSIDYAGDGNLNYRFYAKDVMYEATGAPASDSIVNVTNNSPSLTWTGAAGYVSDGANPDSVAGGSNFVFNISYTDSDNNAPSSVQVWIDENDNNAYDAGEKYEMTEADAGDTVYTDGKLFTVTRAVSYSGDGSLTYRFYASDGTVDATGSPVSNSNISVTSSNNAPVLTWTGTSGYGSDGVNPDTGAACIDLVFRVKYSDSDNNAPSSIQVWIDENDNSTYEAGEKYDLTQVDAGDTVYSDGKLYTVTRTVLYAGDGSLTYRFYASDGSVEATGTPVSDSTVTVADALEVPAEYATIQAAINAASNGDYVCVADGTYGEQIDFSNKAITIKSFNGAASTIISGSGANTAVVVINSGEGSGSILDGFTIDNQASNSTQTRGIVIVDSTPIIRNSIIVGNASTNNYGGGIYIGGAGGGATIENCVIGTEGNSNIGSNGGGVSFRDSVTGTLTIKDSTISYNNGTWNGGGMYMSSNANTTVIENTTISNNSAGYRYGGGIIAGNSSLSITDSQIDDNTASWGGAGLYLSGDGLTTTTLENSTVSGNVVAWGSGGGINLQGSNSTLACNNSTIADNNTNNTFSGGGLFAVGTSQTITFDNSTLSGNNGREGGGINFSGSDNTLLIRDSEIVSNISFFGPGGGIKAVGGTVMNIVTVERTVISGNDAQGPGGSGGGVWVSSTADPATIISATFENCMVTGNNALTNGGGFIFSGAGTTVNIKNNTLSGNAGRSGGAVYNTSAILTLKNSILWGNRNKFFTDPKPEIGGSGTTEITNTNIQQDGYEGNGNMKVDPLFVDSRDYSLAPTAGGDYHLQTDSPVIDQAGVSGALVDDVDGNARPQGAAYDMGADEVLNEASINNMPAILWTGENDYASDGVNPDTAPDASNFEFRIKYSDADNSAPASIRLWLDGNDNSTYEGFEVYDMTETDSGDTNYTDGKQYAKTLSLSKPVDGTISYKFDASDGSDDAIGTPTYDSTVTVNTVPSLAWTGEVNYTSDGVDPDSAASGSSFEFRVDYVELENEASTAIQVWVDEDDSGTYEADEKYDMSEVDVGDTDYTDGKRYTKTLAITYTGDGVLYYRFHATDGISDATGDPTFDSTVTVTTP